jgi:hypothetical protein
MAVPRPVLIAILGLALCVAALIAARGVGQPDETTAPAPLPTATQPVKKKASPSKKVATSKPAATASTPSTNGSGSSAGAGGEKIAQTAVTPKLSAKERTLTAVKTAIDKNEVVVLFFSRPGAADDTGARSAVRKLRGMKGVEVYSPAFEDLSDYRPILAGTGVSQVPAIAIVKPGKKAVLIEGYVDQKTLRQQVRDALR